MPGFARHRLALFREALAGCSVVVLDASDPELEQQFASARPELVVTAGAYGPTRAALGVAGDRPLWLDLPGDPFADAQAYAGGDPAVSRDAVSVFGAALARADAFSTISNPSRFALLGQLGLLGRVTMAAPLQDLVAVVPVAWDFGPALLRAPRELAPRPLRVLLAGSFNTWLDDETLLAGLLRVMDRAPVEVLVLGGPVPGHAEEGWRRFSVGVAQSPHQARFVFRPWVEDAELAAAVASCHVGVTLDRPGLEPEFGSRTRLLFFLHHGLTVVATTRCELARELAAEGLVHPVPPGDPDALAAALLGPLPVPDVTRVAARYAPDRVTAPLRRWVAAPTRLPRVPSADPLVAAHLERDRLLAELASIRLSPLFRGLNQLRRRLTLKR